MLQDQLTHAIWKGDVTLVCTLLARGASPNEVDLRGWTPLMQAAEMENTEIIEVLLSNGGDPNLAGYEGTTPLHVAVDIAIDGTIQTGGSPGDEPVSIIQRLLAAGANIESRDQRGETPLDLARAYRSNTVIATLLGQV